MALMRTSRKGDPPGKKISISGAKAENIFYADIKDPVARKKAAAEYENKAYEKSLKSGYVPLSSLDPTSRKLWSNAIGKSSGVYGDVSDYSVSGPVKSYEDIYGKGSKFNPEEFESASKSGNLDKYMSKNPELTTSGIPRAKYGGIRYRTDADEKKEKEVIIGKLRTDLGNPSDVKVGKLPLLKPGKIAAKTTGGIRKSEPQEPTEKSDWEAPSKSEYKSKSRFKIASNANIFERGPLNSAKVEQKSSKYSRVGGYAREGKMAKAYFGGFENQPISTIGETRATLKKDKSELKAGIKTARKAGDVEKVQGYRASKKDVNAEIKQTKLAGKYLKKLGKEYTGVREGEELRSTGRIKAFTPEKMAGFTGSKQDTYNSDANFNKFLVKSSTDNPVNKNKTFGRKESNPKKKN
jgi:hypothetical protein